MKRPRPAHEIGDYRKDLFLIEKEFHASRDVAGIYARERTLHILTATALFGAGIVLHAFGPAVTTVAEEHGVQIPGIVEIGDDALAVAGCAELVFAGRWQKRKRRIDRFSRVHAQRALNTAEKAELHPPTWASSTLGLEQNGMILVPDKYHAELHKPYIEPLD